MTSNNIFALNAQVNIKNYLLKIGFSAVNAKDGVIKAEQTVTILDNLFMICVGLNKISKYFFLTIH